MRSTKARKTGTRKAAWLLSAVVALVLGTAGLASAQAAPTIAARLSVSSATVDNSYVYVSGELLTVSGQALSAKTVTVDLNTTPQGKATTGADGSYSLSFARPDAGNYTVRVRWDGDADHTPASGTMRLNVPELVTKCGTSLILKLDPHDANPGGVVAITGNLTCADAPIQQAVVQLSTTYGNVDAIVATDDQGGFYAYMAVPDGSNFPNTYTVTAAFGGDEVYIDSSAATSGRIVAAPSETPKADASPSASVAASAPTLVSTASPTTTPSPTVSNPSITDDSSMIAVIVAFCSVALIAAGALVILAVISHNRKRLDQDERRGFGTDFGKDH